jgi:hypothetical protein
LGANLIFFLIKQNDGEKFHDKSNEKRKVILSGRTDEHEFLKKVINSLAPKGVETVDNKYFPV